MGRSVSIMGMAWILAAMAPAWGADFSRDRLKTSGGDLEMTFIGHGTLMFAYNGRIIHVDPWSKLADYTTLPQADLILITHQHRDHLDPGAIEALRKQDTEVIANRAAGEQVPGSLIMANGEVRTVQGLRIEAVPAYNLIHKRPGGEPFHPRGEGNGYVITFGDTRVYVAGDTENIPEMKDLTDIACAFLPMNLPYTMTPEMAAAAARIFKPRILYPYHYGDTDPHRLAALLQGSGIEVRIRELR